jgi:hypothetical protein
MACVFLLMMGLGGCRLPRLSQPAVERSRIADRLLDELVERLQSGPDLPEIFRLLTPQCRSGAPGIAPRVTELAGGYQIARWVERLRPGKPILADVGMIFGSYASQPRCELLPLRSRRYFRTLMARAQLHCEGIDWAGWRRADDGLVDLRWVQGPAGWRLDRLQPAWVRTVRRQEPGYLPLGDLGQGIGRTVAAEVEPGPESLPTRARPVRGPEPASARGARRSSVGELSQKWALVAVDAPGPASARGFGADRAQRGLALVTVGKGGVYRAVGELGGGPQGPQVSLIAPMRTSSAPEVLAVADIDGDGLSDLLVDDGGAGLQTWLQRAEGEWKPSPLLAQGVGGGVRAAALGDFDRDGWLDALLVRRGVAGKRERSDLLRFGAAIGDQPREAQRLAGSDAHAVCVGDLNDDGWPDALLVGPRGSVLWINRQGRFVAAPAGMGLQRARGRSCAVGDLDGDRRLDVFVGGAPGGAASVGHVGTLWFNRGRGPNQPHPRFVAQRLWSSTRGPALGGALLDHDNDGDLDLWAWHSRNDAGEADTLWVNSTRGALTEAGWVVKLPEASGRTGHVVYDFDRDGALDLFTQRSGLVRWAGGEGDWGDPEATHGLLLRLRARGRGNRDALGARVALRSARGWQLREVGAATSGLWAGPAGEIHFGVGSDIRVAEICVRWPDGQWERHRDLPVDRSITVVQGEGVRWGGPASVGVWLGAVDTEDDSESTAESLALVPPGAEDDSESTAASLAPVPSSAEDASESPAASRAPARSAGGASRWRSAREQDGGPMAALMRLSQWTVSIDGRPRRIGDLVGGSSALVLLVGDPCPDCGAVCARLRRAADSRGWRSLAVKTASSSAGADTCALATARPTGGVALASMEQLAALLPLIVELGESGRVRAMASASVWEAPAEPARWPAQ